MRDDMQDEWKGGWKRDDGEAPGRRRTGRRGGWFRVTPQAVLGVLVIVFGLLLTGDNLELFSADEILRYWPLGLVAVGLLKLVQSSHRSGWVAGGLLTFFGLMFTAEVVLNFPIDVDDWWPVVLIGLGVMILTRSVGRSTKGTVPASADQTISEFAFWSGKVRRTASPAFSGGDLTAVMGGIELDLRGSAAAGGEAVLDVFAMWGGIEIQVPTDWAVSNEVNVLMGGAEDRSTGDKTATNRLVVRGLVIMGGIEIKT